MLDARLHIADRIGQPEGVLRLLLEQVERDALRGACDSREPGQLVHQV